MSRKGASKSGPSPFRHTEDGLHLEDSILWFDSAGSGELSFLSSAVLPQTPKVPQVIATSETVKLLEIRKQKPAALVCQYNRPFSIGRLRMELLPSGCVLGGASLYLEIDRGRILYAPQLQPQRVPTVRQMQLKRANTLILGAWHPDPASALPNRKKEKERLLETVMQHVRAGQWPAIMCEPTAVAPELTKLFQDAGLPVAVHDAIYKVNQVYESFGSKLGEFTRYKDRQHTDKILLFPLPKVALPGRTRLPDRPLIYVEKSLEETLPPAAFRKITARFHISPFCDGPETLEIITAVSPKELYFIGPYAKRYVEGLSAACPNVKPLYPNDQPALF